MKIIFKGVIRMTNKQALEQFYTNKILADFLVEKTLEVNDKLLNECTFLEPSCGNGALIQAMIDSGIKEEQITAYDIDIDNIEIVKKKYPKVKSFCCDFLELEMTHKFDVCIMNPPWGKLEVDRVNFFRQYSKLPPSTLEKEKIYEELLKDGDIKKRYDEYCKQREQAIKNKNYLKTYHELFLEKCLKHCNYVSIICPDLFSRVLTVEKEKSFREYLYKHLRFLFRFHNEKKLFEDVGNCIRYTMSIFGGEAKQRFTLMDNLYHPKTIASSQGEDEEAPYPGTKNKNGEWELRGHPHRLVEVNEELLKNISKFTGSKKPWQSVLPTLHGKPEQELFIKLGAIPKIGDFEYSYYRSIDETRASKKGLISRSPGNHPLEEMVLTGPNIFVGHPSNKEPNEGCKSKGDFTRTELQTVPENFLPKTVYRLTEEGKQSAEYLRKTPWGEVHNFGYRVAARFMLGTTGVRTLSCAIIPPKITHINGLVSLSFSSSKQAILSQSTFMSILLDFLLRNIGSTNFYETTIQILPTIPLSAENNPLVQALAARTLRLNCISNHYSSLYQEIMEAWGEGIKALDLGNLYESRMKHCFISKTYPQTPRLFSYKELPSAWSMGVPLRKFEDREQALCEVDALVAILFGISKKSLLNLYRSQFAVLQKNFQDFPDQIPDRKKQHFPRYKVREASYD